MEHTARLLDLMTPDGPTATVVLNAPSDIEDAPQRFDIGWRNARRQLDDAGFATAGLDQLDETLAGLSHHEGQAIYLVQHPGSETFVEALADAFTDDLAVIDELARVSPVIESRQASLPHLVVIADRAGADILGFAPGVEPDAVEVEGSDLHIHRGAPGGWSQRRFQQRAENRWESNAGEVAEAVAGHALRFGPRFIAVAGDVRAVTFLLEQLPPSLADITRKLDGQSTELIAEETTRAVADQVTRDTRSVLERFREAVGRGLAANGVKDTLAALAEGRVDVLLVHDEPDDDRRARFERDGTWCAALGSAGGDGVAAPGGDTAEGRLVDVAIRSALLGGAEIRIVPAHGGPDDNLGAILRW